MQEKASHIVPIVCRNVLNDEVTTVFGMDYDTPDGTAIRDYTHVFDIATAHLASMHYLGDGGKSDVFNIGRGEGNSVLDVLKAFKNVTGTMPEHTFAKRRAGDPPITHAENTKAKEKLGWSPVFGLDDIVEHSLAWETKNHKDKK
jgi:UDP-glucose 4-epimerase